MPPLRLRRFRDDKGHEEAIMGLQKKLRCAATRTDKNRISAALSRARKAVRLTALEDKLATVVQDNTKLASVSKRQRQLIDLQLKIMEQMAEVLLQQQQPQEERELTQPQEFADPFSPDNESPAGPPSPLEEVFDTTSKIMPYMLADDDPQQSDEFLYCFEILSD